MPSFTPVDYDPFGTSAPPAPPPAPVPVPGPSIPAPSDDSSRPLTVRVGPAPAQPLASPASPGGPPTASAQPPTFTTVDYDPFAPSWLDTAGDVAQSAATGIEKGAIGLVTAPVAIGDYLQGRFSAAADQVLGPKPQIAPSMNDLVTGARPTGGMLHDIATNTGDYVGAGGVTRDLEAVAGPMYQPQTTAGRYAETVGEFVPGATGGGVGGFAKYALAPGLASEAAGQATQGSVLEPYARAVAPILAGGIGGLTSRPGTAAGMLRDAAGALDQPTLGAAQDLMDAAARQGTPISLAEAVQQVTNSATRLGPLQRVVEQSRGGADTMAKFYSNRPGQVQQAGNAAIDTISPVPANPSSIGPAVQQAGQGALDATPQGQAAQQAVWAAGPRTTPEQAGQVIQPALRQTYEGREGMRAAQADRDYAAARNATPQVDVNMLDPRSYTPPPRTTYRYDPATQGYAPHDTPEAPPAPAALAGPDASGFVQTDPRQVVAHIDEQLATAKGRTAMSLRRVRSMLNTTGGALDTSVAGLGNVREQVGAMITKAVQDGDGFTASRLRDVQGQIDDTLSDVPAHATATRNFRAASAPLAPFDNDPALSAAIERDPYNSRFTTPADRVPGLIDNGGSSSVRAFADVATTPARQAYENHVTTQLLDQAMGARGVVDPDRLATMLRDNADRLRQLPAVQARIQRVIDTQRATEGLRDTPVGRLAATRDFREQAAVILDPNPVPGSAHEVGEAVRQIAARAPEAARALVSQRIRQVFNEATQTNMGGPNQWGGAKFNAVVRGNDQQARNLKAAVEALHGPGTWRDFQKTLDVFEAMGRRHAPGSQTEPNRQIAAELQKGSPIGATLTTSVSPGKLLGKASEIYDGWKYGRNTASLAEMLTRPDAAKVLGAIAKAPAGSSQAQGMAAMYLLNTSSNQNRKAIAK